MKYGLDLFLIFFLLSGVAFSIYVVLFRKKRLLNDLKGDGLLCFKDYPFLEFRKKLSEFFLSSRLYSDDMVCVEHKNYKFMLFETWLGVPPVPYKCVAFYCPFNGFNEQSIYLGGNNFMRSEAELFYKNNVSILNKKSIHKILSVVGLDRMQLHRDPVFLEKNNKGTLIVFNEHTPSLEALERLCDYLEATDCLVR